MEFLTPHDCFHNPVLLCLTPQVLSFDIDLASCSLPLNPNFAFLLAFPSVAEVQRFGYVVVLAEDGVAEEAESWQRIETFEIRKWDRFVESVEVDEATFVEPNLRKRASRQFEL